MIARIRFLCFGLFIFGQVYGQGSCDCFIEGVVRDKSSREAIVGALVRIPSTNKAVLTDFAGRYKLANLCQGTYQVQAEIVGYKPVVIRFDLVHEGKHEFELSEDEIHLDQVTIFAEKVENAVSPKETWEGYALQRQMGGMLGEVIRKTPGVTLLQTGHSIVKPVIHGLHSNRVLILNHGIRQEGQQWGSEHAPEIDPFLAQRITVITGAGGLRYGSDALGGTLLIEPGKLRPGDPWKAHVQQSYFSNGHQWAGGGSVEHGWKKMPFWQFRWQGSGKRGGTISTPDYRMANTGLQEINFSTTAFYRKQDWEAEFFFSQYNAIIGLFSGAHIGNVTDLLQAIQSTRPQEIYTPDSFSWRLDRPQQNLQHNLWKNKVQWKSWSLEVSRQYNYRQEIDILRGDRNLSQTFRLVTYLTDLRNSRKLTDRHTGDWGIQSTIQSNVSTGQLREPLRSTVIIPNFQQVQGAVYSTHSWQFERGTLELGGRWDVRQTETYALNRGGQPVSNTFFFQNGAASVGFNRRVGAASQWSFSLTRTWRPPSINELLSDGVHHGAASYEVGNVDLRPEISHQGIFKWNWQIGPRAETRWTAYAQLIDRYIFLVPSGQAVVGIRGAFPAFFYTQTPAFFRGMDWQGSWKWHPLGRYSWQGSFVLANDLARNQPLPFIAPPEWRHQLAWQLTKSGLEFELEHHLVAQQTRLPNQIVVSTESIGVPIPLIQGDFAAAPRGYQLFNAGFRWENESKPWSIQLDVQNLLNTRYRAYLDRFRYFVDAPGRNVQLRFRYRLGKK